MTGRASTWRKLYRRARGAARSWTPRHHVPPRWSHDVKPPRGGALAWTAVAGALAGFAACLAGWLAGGGSVDVAWAPTLDLRLDLALDGLGALYALLATGIGTVVFAYGAAYLPLHLEHERRPAAEGRRFWPWMTLFMVSMVGLACARDLVLLFVFFDLTAVASYFLIGFDRDRREARGAALMALLVTGVSAVALLLGAVLLYDAYGTFSLPELFERARGDTTTTIACALIAVAALAKSAQVPLHFWLPRAMAAPTPVSAYLHSAAMVAAGVLVLGRVHPLLALDRTVLDGLLVVGLASIVVGGVLALAQDELKQILAHSTISQYGYVVALYGIGGAAGAGAAALYVLTHAIAKSALFMTAGAVTMATGRVAALAPRRARAADAGAGGRERRGGRDARRAPADARVLQGRAVLRRGPRAGHARGGDGRRRRRAHVRLHRAVLARALHGRARAPRRARSPRCSSRRSRVLAAVALAGGFVVGPFAGLAGDAAAVTHGAAVDVSPAYHLDARAENVMAVAAWALGAAFLLLRARPRRRWPARSARAGDRLGPRRWYGVGAAGAQRATRTGSTTPRSATCATASPRCSSPPACSSRSASRSRRRGARSPSGRSRPATCRSSSCSCSASRRRSRSSATPAGCGPSSRSRSWASRWPPSTPSRARRTSRSWRSWSRRSSRSSSSGSSRACRRRAGASARAVPRGRPAQRAGRASSRASRRSP